MTQGGGASLTQGGIDAPVSEYTKSAVALREEGQQGACLVPIKSHK